MRARFTTFALAAAVSLAGTELALAQTWQPGQSARDGRMDQAIADTIGANLRRRGYTDQLKTAATMSAVTQWLWDQHVSVANCMGQPTTGWNTFYKILRCNGLPLPIRLGIDGDCGGWWCDGGGAMGGGGATGREWEARGDDCGEFNFEFDPQGNLIIPSTPLEFGGPVQQDPYNKGRTAREFTETGCWNCYYAITTPFTFLLPNGQSASVAGKGASNRGGPIRWQLHRANQMLPREAWFGVVYNTFTTGTEPGRQCSLVATVAYINPQTNQLVSRREASICSGRARQHGFEEFDLPPNSQEHFPCPIDESSTGGDFHYYSDTEWNGHFHDCIWYAPRPDVTQTPDGYQINPRTTIAATNLKDFPNNLPDFLKRCRLNPSLLARIADMAFRGASQRPGYAGHPYGTVTEADARPGDTRVGDLGDTPAESGGTQTPPPTPDPNTPPPETPPSSPDSGYRDECDFGPGGCTSPNTPAPELGEEPAASSVLDPIFNWLPDLPSLSINTGGAQCPIWEAQPFGWQLRLESHCGFIEENRALIGTIMMIGFMVGAAMIILRA